ncbi:HNH endonuclease [Streptomyces atriruber]|uniref:HNH endonuclease n=1 Tax=Streptomyces atriruber TaxID=545121 RepID=A0ABV3BX52_9ACTN
MRHGHPLNATRRRMRKEQLARRHGQCCAYCRRPFASLQEATLDHIAPRSLWSSWSVTSLMLACANCNQAKADRLPLSLALVLLAWVDPTTPVVRPVDWTVLARLAAANLTAPTSVTSCVTPRPADGESSPVLHESTLHRSVRRSIVRPDCLRAPRPVRACTRPTGGAVFA